MLYCHTEFVDTGTLSSPSTRHRKLLLELYWNAVNEVVSAAFFFIFFFFCFVLLFVSLFGIFLCVFFCCCFFVLIFKENGYTYV